MKKCPACQSTDIRRSSTPVDEKTWRDRILSRYRCRACRQQFWAVGARTYRAGASLVAAVAMAAVAVFLFSYFLTPDLSSRAPRRSDGGERQRVQLARSALEANVSSPT
jgi:hypothetical protein